jgi:RNA polymerase sigma-70 factor (ECF subfamily)
MDMKRKDVDSAVFDEMLSYKEVVFRICLGFSKDPWDAEDLAQEVYIKAWRKLDTLKDRGLLRAWLFKVTRNTCLDHINQMRLRKFFHPLSDETREPRDNSTKTPEYTLEFQQQLELLKDAVGRLSVKLREVFVLKEYGHLSYREIAAAAGIEEGTVMSRLNRARKEITAWMRRVNNG